jgi:hypothetical protein
MTDDREWRTAIHESGHAVVVRLLGLKGGGATIEEPGAHATTYAINWRTAIICALGGIAAEQLVFGDYDRDGSATDRGRVERWSQRLGLGADEKTASWNHTLALLRSHKQALMRVALALKRARSLDGAAIDRLFVSRGSQPPQI